MDAKLIEVAPGVNLGFEGQHARNTPPVTFNLWSSYKLAPGWKAGLGLESKDERFAYSPSSATNTAAFTNGKFGANRLSDYTRLDAMLAYEQAQWSVKLNVKNLLDKTYYDAIFDNGGFTVPGNGRTAIVTTEYKF